MRPASERAGGPPTTAPTLEDLQRWLQLEIAHPSEGGELPPMHPPAEEIVLPSATLTPSQRVGIYAESYYLRLRSCLAVDFPAVQALCERAGPGELWDRLCKGYLARHPSRTFTLGPLGWQLPRFLDELDDQSVFEPPLRALLRDVAQLEVAICQVFDAAPSVSIETEALGAVSPEAWPQARVRFIDPLQVHAFDHRANAIATAVRQDRELPSLEPAKTWVAVYRKGYSVWRVDLSEARYALLQALRAGRTLEVAIEQAADSWDGPGLDQQIFRWLSDWVREGLFTAVELDGA